MDLLGSIGTNFFTHLDHENTSLGSTFLCWTLGGVKTWGLLTGPTAYSMALGWSFDCILL